MSRQPNNGGPSRTKEVERHAPKPKTGSILDLVGLLHDPARKPLTDAELEQAIDDAVLHPEPED